MTRLNQSSSEGNVFISMLTLLTQAQTVFDFFSKNDLKYINNTASLFVSALVIFVGIAIFGAMREKQFISGGDNTAVNYTFQAGFYISVVAGVLGLIAGLLFRIDKTLENCRHET